MEPEEVARHCLEGADLAFVSKVQSGGIVVAGTYFGSGSSREHAAIALKHAGVAAVVAESFAHFFYCNAINLALPFLVCRARLKTGTVWRSTWRRGLFAIPGRERSLRGEALLLRHEHPRQGRHKGDFSGEDPEDEASSWQLLS